MTAQPCPVALGEPVDVIEQVARLPVGHDVGDVRVVRPLDDPFAAELVEEPPDVMVHVYVGEIRVGHAGDLGDLHTDALVLGGLGEASEHPLVGRRLGLGVGEVVEEVGQLGIRRYEVECIVELAVSQMIWTVASVSTAAS